MPERRWWLVSYPNGVRQVEWLTAAEAEVKKKATGNPVVPVTVTRDEQ